MDNSIAKVNQLQLIVRGQEKLNSKNTTRRIDLEEKFFRGRAPRFRYI